MILTRMRGTGCRRRRRSSGDNLIKVSSYMEPRSAFSHGQGPPPWKGNRSAAALASFYRPSAENYEKLVPNETTLPMVRKANKEAPCRHEITKRKPPVAC
jgi:hypothetical protein